MDISLDVETMGTKPGSIILSIGATLFDPWDPAGPHFSKDPAASFYVVPSFFDSYNKLMPTEEETMKWWQKQLVWATLSAEAMASKLTLDSACDQFLAFVGRTKPEKVWANSPSFDVEFMKRAMRKTRREWPFTYRQEMDYRTIMDTVYRDRAERPARPREIAEFPDHHALGDAKLQAFQLVEAHKILALALRPSAERAPRRGRAASLA